MLLNIISILIPLLIAAYFIRKEMRKEKHYFGKSVDLTRQEKKILASYKAEYSPIKTDPRLPTLKKDGWELEDVSLSATEVVYDGPIPTKEQKKNIKPGDLVKLVFLFDEEGVTEAERMWVKVIGESHGLFSAEIDNDPFVDIVKAGQTIWFHSNHVFQIRSTPK